MQLAYKVQLNYIIDEFVYVFSILFLLDWLK